MTDIQHQTVPTSEELPELPVFYHWYPQATMQRPPDVQIGDVARCGHVKDTPNSYGVNATMLPECPTCRLFHSNNWR